MNIDFIYKDIIMFSNLAQICGYHPIQDTCTGDSGGPMTVEKNYRHFLIGVVSYGNSHCGKEE